MAIEITDLTVLPQADVTANVAQAAAYVQELHPEQDLRRGPVHDLVVSPHAILLTAHLANLRRYLSARSLLAVSADPTLADPDVLDDIASNFRVTRRGGAAASGPVTLVVSAPTTVTLPPGAVFYAAGQQFTTTRVYTAKLEPEQVAAAGDVLMTPLASGGYAFTISVTAVNAGTAGMLRQNAAVVPLAPPQGFVGAYVSGDFVGGADAETNATLVARLLAGVAAPVPSNRVNMAAMLRASAGFANYQALSVVGYGDPEMRRDKHSVFPVSGGGRVDWYVRFPGPAYNTSLSVTARLVTDNGNGTGTWQFAVGRDDAPGYYEIRDIVPQGADPAAYGGGYTVTSDVRQLDLSGGGFTPDVVDLVEGAYSRYQAGVIQFTAPVPAGTAVGAEAAYTATAVGQPSVAELQAYIGGRDVRPYGGDVLVRAPVPCFVRVALTVQKPSGTADPDVAGMAAAVAAAVNGVGFTGRLFLSSVYEAVTPYLGAGSASGLAVVGRVRYPDGTLRYVKAGDVLSVPADPSACVSDKTVQFYLDPADVAIAVVSTLPPY